MRTFDERPVVFRANLEPAIFDAIEIHAIVRAGLHGGRPARALPLVFKELDPGTGTSVVRPEPALVLSRDEAQGLMDELWRVGLRPSEGTGSAGSLAATQRHLDDMRALAFAKLGVTKP